MRVIDAADMALSLRDTLVGSLVYLSADFACNERVELQQYFVFRGMGSRGAAGLEFRYWHEGDIWFLATDVGP